MPPTRDLTWQARSVFVLGWRFRARLATLPRSGGLLRRDRGEVKAVRGLAWAGQYEVDPQT
jgi:hypothetical protein